MPEKKEVKKYEYKVIYGKYNGKRKKFRGKTLEEAMRKQWDFERAIEAGEVGLTKDMTVNRWAKEWMETYKKDRLIAKTYKDYLSRFDNHIAPAIGSLKLSDVRDVHLQKILNEQVGKSYSHAKKIQEFLKAMFRQARVSRIISYDPAEALVLPKTKKGVRRSITPHEREHILKVSTSHRAGFWIKVMLYCGLRPGETYALEWRHVDFQNKRLHIEQAKESGSREIKEPKTEAGERSVPVPDDLLEEFWEVFIAAGKDLSKPIFPQTRTGNFHTETSGRRMWKSFKRAVDISMGAKLYRNQIVEQVVADDLVPYCLRHTYGTDLQDAGVPLNVAKYLMGHSDVRVTANIYTDTSEHILETAASQINTLHKKRKVV